MTDREWRDVIETWRERVDELTSAGDELARAVLELGHGGGKDGAARSAPTACPLCAALHGWRAARV